jgi:hypothetical protein
MNLKIIFVFFIFSISFFIIYQSFLPRCEWIITNCCPENAGAKWECVNVKTYKPKIDCSKFQIICPQVLSPKPNLSCVLENNKCVIK